MHILKGKANLLFALALLALAILFWVPFRESSRLLETEREVGRTREVLQTSADLRKHLSGSVAARRGYLLYGDAKLFDAFAQERREALESYAALRRLSAENPEQQEKLQELEPALQSRLILLKQSVELHQKGGDDREAQGNLREQGAPLEEEIQKDIRQFEDVERAQLAQRKLTAASALRLSNWLSVGLAVGVLSVVALALWIINREQGARVRAERALAGSEKLVESVLNSIGEGILVADRSGKVTLSNSAAYRFHEGAPRQEIGLQELPQTLGLHLPDKITPYPVEDLPLARAIRGESVDDAEIFVRTAAHPEGRWVLVTSRPRLDEKGERQGGVVVFRDITEQKKAQAALQTSEARLSYAQSIAHVGSWEWNLESGEQYWSDEIYRICGLAPRQMGASVEEFMKLVHPEDRELVKKSVRGALEGKKRYDIEHRILRPDGQERIVHEQGEMFRDPSGKVVRMAGVVQDITERKQAEQRLAEHDRMLQLILNSIGDGIMVADSSRKTVLRNPVVARMYKDVPADTPPEDLPRVMGLYQPDMTTLYQIEELPLHQAIRGESVDEVEIYLRPPGEKEGRWLLSSGRPLLDESGRSHGGVVSVRDITARKRAEEELRQANERVSQILESISDSFIGLDKDFRFTYVNAHAANVLQRPAAELLGRDLWKEFPKARGTPVESACRRALEQGVPVHIQNFYKPFGKWFDVYVYPAPDGLSLFYSDITESKEAEEKIRKAGERTRQILESITDAFMAWDHEDRIVYINENGARLLQHTREELLGTNAWEMFPAVTGTLFESETKRALRERTVVHYEEYFSPIDAWLETHMYPSAEGLSVFFRDITARRLAQAERENLLKELSEALANVKKLSGMLPICSACKKVRDDSGYWSQIEDYVRRHSEAQFSHGICPDCMRSLYPDMAEQVESKLKKLEEDKKKN